jgi:hypothetical protein
MIHLQNFTINVAELFVGKEDAYSDSLNQDKKVNNCIRKIAIISGVVAGIALTVAAIAAASLLVPPLAAIVPFSLTVIIAVGGAAGGVALISGSVSAIFAFGAHQHKKDYIKDL